MAKKADRPSTSSTAGRRSREDGEQVPAGPLPPHDSEPEMMPAPQTPVFPPPVAVSKFLVPIRFRELWADADIEPPDLPVNALPSELWEGVCAVLWHRAKEHDPGAEKLRSAIVRALRAWSRKPDLQATLRALAAAQVPQGRARGKAISDIHLVSLHPRIMEILEAYHSRGKGYSRDSLVELEANLEDAWERCWEILGQDDPFPREALLSAIREKGPPRAIADLFFGRACQTTPDTIAKYLKEARGRLRKLASSPEEKLRSVPGKIGFDVKTNKLGRSSWVWRRKRH
jgi:hypothetical protein